MMRFSVFILFSSFLLFGCRKDKKTTTFDLGTNYFPRIVGSWVVYDIDSIIHDDNDAQLGYIDTFKYQFKEIIESKYTDASGLLNHRIERYSRTDTTDWVILDVWSSRMDNFRAIQVEENIDFIKLIFAPKIGDTWNGNTYNTLEVWDYEYTSVDSRDTINTLVLDSVLTVVQKDDANIIEREYAEEKYARGIGRVSKTYISLDIQNESGVEYYEVINSFGN
ncbi:MAG: hypothetical protein HOK72_05915 [Flavobacteriales bacterium]|nr:hypothetical protein [Flavobacteriales bacterium]